MDIRPILLVVALLGLEGCASSLKRDFDCPGTPGVQCKSITEVNSLVDKGVIPKLTAQKQLFPPIKGVGRKAGSDARRPAPIRFADEVLSVWVAPYEDELGVYHQPGLLTAVVRPAHWKLS